MNEYTTVWQDAGNFEGMDGKYIPIGRNDKDRLEKALKAAMVDDDRVPNEYYLERLQATHFFISVTIPEDADIEINGITGADPDCTWWDFSSMLAKQVDGKWFVWYEDPSDIGNIWYQSTYIKSQAYAVRDGAVEWAENDILLLDGGLVFGEWVTMVPMREEWVGMGMRDKGILELLAGKYKD